MLCNMVYAYNICLIVSSFKHAQGHVQLQIEIEAHQTRAPDPFLLLLDVNEITTSFNNNLFHKNYIIKT